MQKVEMYHGVFGAKEDMNKHIENGWRVHICQISDNEKVLVVYEKEDIEIVGYVGLWCVGGGAVGVYS